jgi:hypothetical protein
MRQVMKTILLAGAVVLGSLPSAWAYSLEGPVGNGGDAWQSPVNGFGPPRDSVAPKNLGEEYRRNTPVMFYACDQTFLDYFGSNGVVAVDNAYVTLNSAFTNNPTGMANGLDSYSLNLSEFPLNSRHVNYQAQALGVFDLKSTTLGIMMGQLGLADPVMYIWGIHDRTHLDPGPPCPLNMEYLVVQRNFDFVSSPQNQLQYSPYVNDTLYSYDIIENCLPPNPVAWANPYPVDPLADIYTPVSAWFNSIFWGDYYTGLTRDDVAGLRYLLQTNNVNRETASADSLLFTITTNSTPGAQQVFPPYILSGGTNVVLGTNGGYYVFIGTTNGGVGYGNLAAFLAFASTNPPAAVQAAYPGVVISSVSYTVVIASNATYSSYYAPPAVGSTYGSPPQFVVVTNYTPFFQFIYTYTFANIFTNHYSTNSFASLQTLSFSAPVGSPYGSPTATNVSVKLYNQISGDFFVLAPFYTNYCPLDILPFGSIPNVLATTNFLTGASTTNVPAAGSTNTAGTTISNSVYLVTYFTNYSYVINPVTCSTTAGATGLYQGIEKMQFVKSSYDSLLGQYFQPVTNNYTMVFVTNSQAQVQYFQRVATTPDFLFAASDQVAGPAGVAVVGLYSESLNFDQANVLPGLAGPGTITTPTTITYEKAGPVFYNGTTSSLDVMDGTPYFTETPGGDVNDTFYSGYFVWGSFDGTTNAPVVYPNGNSIDDLGNMVLVQVSPASVPVGFSDGSQYPAVTFTATGGSFEPPYTWSAVGLPAGLSVSSGGTLSGATTQAGVFVFTLTMTDSLSRSVQWNYPLTIQ